ncbi:MAG: hypothetical protein ACE37J_15525 [Pikeienuella sp.]|uniref:hypothetical protein n=1 Tax=Pikeienuella sp. TaxID=2831957 RepID=UPI00391C2418
MDVLEGAAAFAVVMIVFSTIVTGIAEAFLRLLAMRQKVLADAIESLIVNEILPAAKAGLKGALDTDGDGNLSAEDLKAQVAKLSRSPLAKAGSKILLAPMRFGHEQITTYSLLQRLAKSELGDALAHKGRAELRAVLTDIARTYERYAAAAAERFRYKAHRYTAVIAVLFAFGANIDAGRVFVYLMDNPGARAAIIAEVDAAKAANDAALAKLDAALAATGEGTLEEVNAAVDGLTESVAALRDVEGLPIGPSYYPFCGSSLSEVTILGRSLKDVFAAEGCAGNPDRTYFGWIAYTLLAGILIGLGGPFWYNVYASLARVLNVGRALGGETISDKAENQPASRKALTEEDIVTTFEIARAGRSS